MHTPHLPHKDLLPFNHLKIELGTSPLVVQGVLGGVCACLTLPSDEHLRSSRSPPKPGPTTPPVPSTQYRAHAIGTRPEINKVKLLKGPATVWGICRSMCRSVLSRPLQNHDRTSRSRLSVHVFMSLGRFHYKTFFTSSTYILSNKTSI